MRSGGHQAFWEVSETSPGREWQECPLWGQDPKESQGAWMDRGRGRQRKWPPRGAGEAARGQGREGAEKARVREMPGAETAGTAFPCQLHKGHVPFPP